MLQMILLLLPGVLSSEVWKVTHPPQICAVRGSDVSIPCNFTYPKNEATQVTQVSWCSKKENKNCDKEGPYVYNSTNNNNQSNFQYTGDKTSNCSLLISNFTNSSEYIFRFITNGTDGRWTGTPAVNVTVTDLRVSMTRYRDNGTITAGDSLNLTCTVSCPDQSPELQWFKDDEPIKQTNPVLTFSRVTPQDSGNYSCSLRNFKSDSKSEQIRLYVEGDPCTSSVVSFVPFFWIMIIGVSLFSIIFIIAAVVLIRRRAKSQQTRKKAGETQPDTEDVLEEEVQYASVSIKPKELSANTEQQNEDSTIYSAVRAS